MKTDKFYNIALYLAIFTIIYNFAEGLIATYFGFSDDSIALFGFGIDSFIELISALGIFQMVYRIKNNDNIADRKFEKTALKITGISFYLLSIGLIIGAGLNIFTGKNPETTLWGVIISTISIAVMWALIMAKKRIGKALDSDAIIADANCTKVCMYMSLILLLSSGLYEFFNIPYVDSVGAIGIAYLSYKEGKECFEKIENPHLCCQGRCKSNK
jgi:divalent metal cation (Fe/Co/Zn/Cd) transporter